MNLYLRKAAEDTGRGEAREGSYAARVVTGYEKDGSPQYRYFKTTEDYKAYLDNKTKPSGNKQRGRKEDDKTGGKKLKEKIESEQGRTRRKMQASKQKKNNLFVQKKNKKDNEKNNKRKVEKSLRLYVG